MLLSVACSSCGAKLRALDNAVGRTLKCPKWGKPITVEAITAQPLVALVFEPPVVLVYTPPPVPDVKIAEVVPAEPTQACPFCGETVLTVAKKCKHCGETINVSLRAAEEARREMEDAREKVHEAGCEAYETKPVEFEGLLAKIQALLGGEAGPGGRGTLPELPDDIDVVAWPGPRSGGGDEWTGFSYPGRGR